MERKLVNRYDTERTTEQAKQKKPESLSRQTERILVWPEPGYPYGAQSKSL